jgi:hypothetical protein
MRTLGLPYTPADRMTSFAASKISGSVLLPSRYSTPTAVDPSMSTLLTVTSCITCKFSLHAPASHHGVCLTVGAKLYSLLTYGTDCVTKERRPPLLHIYWYQHPRVFLAAALVLVCNMNSRGGTPSGPITGRRYAYAESYLLPASSTIDSASHTPSMGSPCSTYKPCIAASEKENLLMHPRELVTLWAVSEKAAFLEWDRNAHLGVVHKRTASLHIGLQPLIKVRHLEALRLRPCHGLRLHLLIQAVRSSLI